jgi:hypothetical protein
LHKLFELLPLGVCAVAAGIDQRLILNCVHTQTCSAPHQGRKAGSEATQAEQGTQVDEAQ